MEKDDVSRWFGEFINKKKYLDNVSHKTIAWHLQAFRNWEKAGCERLDKLNLDRFVMWMIQHGLSPVSCNVYINAMNSFFKWLYENELAPLHKIKCLKEPKIIQRSYTEREMKEIISFKPRTFGEFRLHALFCTMIDTGCRIDELLTLTRQNTYLDSLSLKVTGKGQKERIVPISIELRKILFKFLVRHKFDLVFPSRQGKKVDYRNLMRDAQKMFKKLGFEPKGMHAFRRSFASQYVKNGGNLFYLQATMGHERLETTRKYVRIEQESLSEMHLKTSLLSRLK